MARKMSEAFKAVGLRLRPADRASMEDKVLELIRRGPQPPRKVKR